jgi:hypothetical protein
MITSCVNTSVASPTISLWPPVNATNDEEAHHKRQRRDHERIKKRHHDAMKRWNAWLKAPGQDK